MCGFAGEWVFDGSADLALAEQMAQVLAHRGPDETGAFRSRDGRVTIGFRRLCVIDPPSSAQPMTDPAGRVTVAFNGEIYNYRELRDRLRRDGAAFRTQGDTEVLLHLYARRGREMLQELLGMFAFCLYDETRAELLLARDRLGQKPLWYVPLGDRVVFASEAKALFRHPAVAVSYDPPAVVEYLSLGYVHAPGSIWRGIYKLPPAGVMRLGRSVGAVERYWTPAPHDVSKEHPDSLRERIRYELTRAVQARMTADVPLGALLSGGIDSAVVVALMAEKAGRTGGVRTFTAGVADPRYDERAEARLIARHCGTDHTELLVSPEPNAMLDWVVDQYDEPFGDSSAIPMHWICRAARAHVTVALVGDGGDECFAGYDRYRALHLSQTLRPWEYLAVRVAAGLVRPIAPLGERRRLRRFLRFAEGLTYPPAVQYFTYRRLFGPEDLLRLLTDDYLAAIDVSAPAEWFCDLYEQGGFDDEVRNAQRHDLLTYLPDDLLVKADIASMAASLELRAPMLDHRVVELGLGLPLAWKITRRRGKIALEKTFGDLLPREVFRRPKRGFAVPLADWLRNELRETMVEALTAPAFRETGIFREEALAGLMNDHLRGTADHSHRLWALMVLARRLVRRER